MTFILVPNKGEDVQVNAWNWRPTLEFLHSQNIITTDHAELLGCNWCGAHVDAALATRMAAAVENKLATLKPGDRMRADLTVTAIPKKLQVFGRILGREILMLTNSTPQHMIGSLPSKIFANDAMVSLFRSSSLSSVRQKKQYLSPVSQE